jgi:hypothetical protein
MGVRRGVLGFGEEGKRWDSRIPGAFSPGSDRCTGFTEHWEIWYGIVIMPGFVPLR